MSPFCCSMYYSRCSCTASATAATTAAAASAAASCFCFCSTLRLPPATPTSNAPTTPPHLLRLLLLPLAAIAHMQCDLGTRQSQTARKAAVLPGFQTRHPQLSKPQGRNDTEKNTQVMIMPSRHYCTQKRLDSIAPKARNTTRPSNWYACHQHCCRHCHHDPHHHQLKHGPSLCSKTTLFLLRCSAHVIGSFASKMVLTQNPPFSSASSSSA